MSGITVGVDGSPNAERALDWAMTEAGLRHAPLTVLAVHQAVVSHATGAPVGYPDDLPEVREARQAAENPVREAAKRISGPQPESVTVRATSGLPARRLSTPQATLTSWSPARAAAASRGCCWVR